jgi:hypothetical protein
VAFSLNEVLHDNIEVKFRLKIMAAKKEKKRRTERFGDTKKQSNKTWESSPNQEKGKTK